MVRKCAVLGCSADRSHSLPIDIELRSRIVKIRVPFCRNHVQVAKSGTRYELNVPIIMDLLPEGESTHKPLSDEDLAYFEGKLDWLQPEPIEGWKPRADPYDAYQEDVPRLIAELRVAREEARRYREVLEQLRGALDIPERHVLSIARALEPDKKWPPP